MIKDFILKQLILVHIGGAATKIKSSFVLAAAISPFPFIFDKLIDWTLSNSAYVLFVFAAIIFDHILGSIIHLFIRRDFTIKKNIVGLVIKIGLVIIVGFLFEGINHIVTGDHLLKEYLVILLRLLVFMYPAGSAFVNSSIVTKGKFPPSGFLKKLSKFQENLNVKEFKNMGENNPQKNQDEYLHSEDNTD